MPDFKYADETEVKVSQLMTPEFTNFFGNVLKSWDWGKSSPIFLDWRDALCGWRHPHGKILGPLGLRRQAEHRKTDQEEPGL